MLAKTTVSFSRLLQGLYSTTVTSHFAVRGSYIATFIRMLPSCRFSQRRKQAPISVSGWVGPVPFLLVGPGPLSPGGPRDPFSWWAPVPFLL